MPRCPLSINEVLHEAKRRGRPTVALRAVLRLLEDPHYRDRPQGPGHPSRALSSLIAEVLEEREELPMPEEPETYGAALRLLEAREFLKGKRYQDQQMRARRQGAHPDILTFERAFVARFRKLGIPMFAHSIVRDPDEQNALFVRGVSLAKGDKSPHVHGLAVDLVHGTLAWNLPRACWEIIGHVGLEVASQAGVEVVWGGSWRRLWDPAHWELADWRSRVLIAQGP